MHPCIFTFSSCIIIACSPHLFITVAEAVDLPEDRLSCLDDDFHFQVTQDGHEEEMRSTGRGNSLTNKCHSGHIAI